ncbi:MAG TPA: TIGR04013 family B12-binding domain/radical SAM domain-containing protein [Elusimicrobia bacterium]|nr:TIGR04013 family B12-binding domain/radical SAM domain-containing protein [Elusimicrobiota bacterium]
MKKRTPEIRGTDLVFYCPKENHYSFNALAGALETNPYGATRLLFAENEAGLLKAAGNLPRDGRAAVLAFSFFTSQKTDIRALIKKLPSQKKRHFTLIAGGSHPSGAPEETLGMGFDYVFRGEGENSLPDFLKSFAAGRPPKRKIIKGNPVPCLDTYPPVSLKWGRFGPVEITRGCPFACAYCQTSFLFGSKPRHRSLDNTLHYVRLMNGRGLRYVRFITPDAFAYGSTDGRKINLEAVKSLLEGAKAIIKDRGALFFGSFPSEVRPEHVTKETLELTRRFADNKRLVIGAQSASPRLLKAIHRGHSVDDVYNSVKLCAKYGFKADVDFIFGLPGETEKDLEETFKFILKIVPLGARIHAHTFMPLPGTPFENKRPSLLAKKTEDFIRALASKGQAFGQWEKQQTVNDGR